ncbi:CRISPR-associated endonuclease Cas3'' [Hyperthermus butylicus]|uniref:HD Cas3-type domain-containing protein n=1 Tax=Hyperthermus butylicus (strain DSM 5456 / JCM 9403 / PLM1-5) TaxID=415426 RepID=A2BKI5_HYPBU|nr:CRISPR-associated endonuclease Cas3'' [Hyperthermus butylicus]ABM80496.1 hypothetical protein Hbut_0639 [Hyperthermus butylicus DSM 5456]
MALYAWIGVRLRDHSINTLGLMLGLFHRELRVTALRLGLDQDTLMLASAVAALLHDAGKAAERYQETVARCYPRFTCHELAGSWVAMETLDVILQLVEPSRSKVELLSAVAAAAVLRHHHGMRSLAACRAAAKQGKIDGLDGSSLKALAEELDSAGSLAATVAATLRELADTAPPPNPLEAEARVRRRLTFLEKKQPALSAATSILTGLLAAADYLAAAILDGRGSCNTRDDNVATIYPRGYAKHVLRELGIYNPVLLKEAREKGYRQAENLARMLKIS